MELETSCLREPVLEFSSIRSTGCKLQQRVIFLFREVVFKILISP
jgi:hypothetical protein